MKLQTNVSILLGSLCTFSSAMVMGLGFGEIKLNSTLNQPLEAEIELINVKDLTEREIVVGMASNAEFERAGVDKIYFLADFDFTVDLDAQGGPVVKVTTEDPVKEPYLNFIVYGQWPSGKLLREYTVLVDLPVFSGSRSGPVRIANTDEPEIETATQAPSEEPVTSPSRGVEPSADNTEAETQYESDVYGPVSSNDTLWAIAASVRPDSSYSVQQTMLAIQRLNPKAFINNNINLLKRGQVLRIPTGDQISELSASDAVREVAGQNDSWTGKQDSGFDDGAQLEGSKNFTETKTDASEVEGRVKLSSNALSGSDDVNQGTIEGEEGSALVEELDVAQEELDAVTRERGEIESKLDALDEQIETMEKLVEVSSAELLALEQAAKQANELTSEQTDSDPLAEAESQETTSEEGAAVEEPSEPVAVEPVAPPVQQQPPKTKSILDLLMENIVYVAGGLGALVLAIAAFLFFRNRDDGFDDDFDDELEDFGSFDNSGFDEESDGYGSGEEPTIVNGDDSTEIADDEQSLEDEVSSEAETEDVVGECDIHLAYGQYDQAEEKLLRALESDPANAQVRLKLLEALSAQGDADAFDANYAKLLVLNDPEVTEKADALREGVLDIGPFDPAKYDTSEFRKLIGADAADVATGDENLDLSDDTLSFEAAGDQQDASADAEGEDLTVITPQSEAPAETEMPQEGEIEDTEELGALLDSDNDDDTALLDDSELSLESDEAEADLDLGDFDIDDLDLDLGEDGIEDGEPSDDLSDIEFNFSGDEDSDDGEASESLSSEFSENLVAESGSTLGDAEGLDFEPAEGEPEIDLSALEESSDLAEGEDLDLESLEDADLDLSETAEADLADLDTEAELDLENLEAEPTTGSTAPEEAKQTAESSAEQPEGDFDVSFNLEDGLDLDELDQELDELASPEAALEEPSAGEEPLAEEEPLAGTDKSEVEEAIEETSEMPLELEGTNESAMEEPETDLESIATQDPVADVQVESSVDAANEPEAEVPGEGAVETAEVAEFDADFEIPDFDPESDDDSNLDFLSDNDETATKLDLARAYIDMGDADGAKDILDEILEEGNDGQKKDAQGLLKKLA